MIKTITMNGLAEIIKRLDDATARAESAIYEMRLIGIKAKLQILRGKI
jgi:hypothetical protein